MSSLLPVKLYGLSVPPGEIMIPAAIELPAAIRITMAAIDPTEEPEANEDGSLSPHPRSTLQLLKSRPLYVGDEDSDEDDEALRAVLLGAADDDEEDESDDDDEPNGGPSDPAKSKKARQEAAIRELLAATNADDDEESDEEIHEADAQPNGVKTNKGKEKATDEDDSDDDEDGLDLEHFVLCTLDTERNYQQPLDITIGEGEKAFFIVTGTHSIHLTGNYVMDALDSDSYKDDDDDEYGLTPDEMNELIGDSDEEDESDELDEVEYIARIQEVDSDNEDAPKLVASDSKKGKNKRPAQDEPETLDDLIAKENGASEPAPDTKLGKKQLKKLKNNKGEAVEVKEAVKAEANKDSTKVATVKSDKKVQFAKNLEQGPTGSAEKAKAAAADGKASLSVKFIQGVKVDDRKLGTGRVAKSGDKVSLRYIGKLESGKVFDSNKKGTPFKFQVGKGEVIKGWDIGVAGMAPGGERRLTIPAHLAYGSKGTPGIPGNSTLIFDLKLLEIK